MIRENNQRHREDLNAGRQPENKHIKRQHIRIDNESLFHISKKVQIRHA